MHSVHQGNVEFGSCKTGSGFGLYIAISIWLMLLVSLLGSVTVSDAADATLFGPKKYTRVQGKPAIFTSTFTACTTAASATLKLTNGSGSKGRVSSAVVTLNGVKVISERDLSQGVPSLVRTVNLKAGLNTIKVTIKSGSGNDDDHHDGNDDDRGDRGDHGEHGEHGEQRD